jgi:hypothetical protein
MRTKLAIVNAVLPMLLLPIVLSAQITLMHRPIMNDYWLSDSLFIGADIMAKDSNKNIIIRWTGIQWPAAIGELAVMLPGCANSSMFLFHNRQDLFPNEPREINLGSFPVGTSLFFQYTIIDSDSLWKSYQGKRFYSGQNRAQIDPYKSDINGRWCAAGQKDSSTVEAGFDFTGDMIFRSIVFEISNAIAANHGKFKISSPRASPPAGSFNSSIAITLSTPYFGNYKVINNTIVDTRPDSASFKIAYTTNGSDPKKNGILYNAPILITKTIFLQAYSFIDDSNWIASETICGAYNLQSTEIDNRKREYSRSKQINVTKLSVFRPNGQKTSCIAANKSDNVLKKSDCKPELLLRTH